MFDKMLFSVNLYLQPIFEIVAIFSYYLNYNKIFKIDNREQFIETDFFAVKKLSNSNENTDLSLLINGVGEVVVRVHCEFLALYEKFGAQVLSNLFKDRIETLEKNGEINMYFVLIKDQNGCGYTRISLAEFKKMCFDSNGNLNVKGKFNMEALGIGS